MADNCIAGIAVPQRSGHIRSAEPVSYTHLDVYKRQDIDRVMQTLPFAQEEPFTEARHQRPLFWFYARKFEKR